jgi:hypothetical protein
MNKWVFDKDCEGGGLEGPKYHSKEVGDPFFCHQIMLTSSLECFALTVIVTKLIFAT